MFHECCKYCKHHQATLSYNIKWGCIVEQLMFCKITHKKHLETDTCKRFKYGIETPAC